MASLSSLKTIPDFLDNSARIFPNKVGLSFKDANFTYQQIKEQANNVSNLLIDKTKKGEVVALLLPNIPEMVFSYFGILGIGRIALLLSPSISDANLIFQIEKTRPKFIILD